MGSYASRTTVTTGKTRTQIEQELERRGASAFGYNRDGDNIVVAFTLDGLQVRLDLPMPARAEFADYTARNGRRVSGQKGYDEETARRWRALLLVVKAKLVAVDEGISTLEREFLADIVLAGGTTVLEEIRPAIDQARAALPRPIRALAAEATR